MKMAHKIRKSFYIYADY